MKLELSVKACLRWHQWLALMHELRQQMSFGQKQYCDNQVLKLKAGKIIEMDSPFVIITYYFHYAKRSTQTLLQKKCEKVVKDPEKSNKILDNYTFFFMSWECLGFLFQDLSKKYQ